MAIPLTNVVEAGGPEVLAERHIVDAWAARRGLKRKARVLRAPGKLGRAMADGALTSPDKAIGTITWQQWLARHGLWVREDALLNGIFGFFSERVFGPRRRELFEHDLKQVDLEGGKKARARIEGLERSLEQLEARQTRLIRSLEHTDDPHGAMFRKIRDRMSEMESERVHKLSELESLQQDNP